MTTETTWLYLALSEDVNSRGQLWRGSLYLTLVDVQGSCSWIVENILHHTIHLICIHLLVGGFKNCFPSYLVWWSQLTFIFFKGGISSRTRSEDVQNMRLLVQDRLSSECRNAWADRLSRVHLVQLSCQIAWVMRSPSWIVCWTP
jgi:hypothetical protein